MFNNSIQLINQLVDEHVVPGAAAAFCVGTRWTNYVVGDRQWLPKPVPLTSGLTYDVASLTKVVVTLPIILQLFEVGRINLTDSIVKYLPECNYPEVTVTNLLTHTSGIEGYIPNRNQLNHDQLKDALLHQLHVGPNLNRRMVYADVNFILLGWIAQRILGAPIQTLAFERVFQPLQMNHATFTPRPEDCVATEQLANGEILQGQVDDPKAQVLGRECGSAGLFATMDDLIKFTDEMLHPNDRILQPATIANLFHDHTINGHLGRSYGWAFDHLKDDYLWQTGYTGTAIVLDRAADRAMILLTNRIHPKAPNETFIPRRNQIIASFLKDA
ncbi:serine hydrolase [Lactobacillus sp. Sy-1]|uniref:serine hydrolase domain-containing protein n=1 Tax=Lactobacillus sp. Sy-1 TaxID=2109645 RepID=UPI001C5BF9A5|nr:serine hydrolase domain-containing protein [Lactobacillus sp. Sy-1]MBW1605852.1 beta-lactamase family protein [Lactobacillus sp. Sy-1]